MIATTIPKLIISGIKAIADNKGTTNNNNPSFKIQPRKNVTRVIDGSIFPKGIGSIIKTHMVTQIKNQKILVNG